MHRELTVAAPGEEDDAQRTNGGHLEEEDGASEHWRLPEAE